MQGHVTSPHPYGRPRAVQHTASGGQREKEAGPSSPSRGVSRNLMRTLPPQRDSPRNPGVGQMPNNVRNREGPESVGPGTPRQHPSDLPQRSPVGGSAMSPSVADGRRRSFTRTAVTDEDEV